MVLTCPACQRPNGSRKVRCLYCGSSLPQMPEGIRDEDPGLPANQLDALVRGAFVDGDVTALRRVLERREERHEAEEVTDPRGMPPRLAAQVSPPVQTSSSSPHRVPGSEGELSGSRLEAEDDLSEDDLVFEEDPDRAQQSLPGGSSASPAVSAEPASSAESASPAASAEPASSAEPTSTAASAEPAQQGTPAEPGPAAVPQSSSDDPGFARLVELSARAHRLCLTGDKSAVKPLVEAMAEALEAVRAALGLQVQVTTMASDTGAGSGTTRSGARTEIPLQPESRTSRVGAAPHPSDQSVTGPLPNGALPHTSPATVHQLNRHGFTLLVEGRGEVGRAALLARALEIDNATARLYALSQHARAVLRGEDQAVLEKRAARVRTFTDLKAMVASQELLLSCPTPWAVLSLSPEGFWRVSAQPRWEEDGAESLPAERELAWNLKDVRLAVPGEVVIRRYREGRGSPRLTRHQERGILEVGERRVQVLDVYCSENAYRLVVGMTDFRGMPGHDPQAALRSYLGLLERIRQETEGRVEARHISLPQGTLPTPGEEDDGLPELSGWPDWEEHSCHCWAFARAFAGTLELPHALRGGESEPGAASGGDGAPVPV